MATEYLGGEVPKIAGFLNELLGMDRNYGGYRPIYPEGAKDYEIAAGEVQPIDYVRQEYGADPGQMGPDQEELAAQAGGPVADNRYETPATPQAIDDGSLDIWPEDIPSDAPVTTAPTLGSGGTRISDENRMIEHQAMLNDLNQEDLDMIQLLGEEFGGSTTDPNAVNQPIIEVPNEQNQQSGFVQAPSSSNPSGAVPLHRRGRLMAQSRIHRNQLPERPDIAEPEPEPQPGDQEVYTKPVSTPELEMAGAIAQMGGQPPPPPPPVQPPMAPELEMGNIIEELSTPPMMAPEMEMANFPQAPRRAGHAGRIASMGGQQNQSQGLINAISNWFSGNKGRTMTPPMATTGDIRNRPMTIGASSSAPQYTSLGRRVPGFGPTGSNTGPAGDMSRYTYQPKFTPA